MPLDLATASDQADSLLQSAVKELQNPLPTPVYSGINTNKVRADADTVRKSAGDTKVAIQTEQDRNAAANDNLKTSIDAQGQATSDKIMADQARSEEIARNNRVVNSWFGIEADSSSEIGMLTQQKRGEEAIARGMLDDIQKRQAVGITDDPMEFLSNLFVLPKEIDVYNRQADKVNGLDATIKDAVENSQNVALRINSGVPTITAAMSKAESDKAFAEAGIKKAQADQMLAAANTDFATKKLAQDIAVFTSSKEATAMDIQEAHMKYESQIAAVRIAESRAARLEAASTLVDKWAQNRALDVALTQFDRTMGNPPNTTTRYAFNKLPKAYQDNVLSVSVGKFGVDALDALETVRMLRPGPGMSEDTKNMFQYLNNSFVTISSDPNIQRLGKEDQKDAVRKALGEKIAYDLQDSANIASPFHELSPAKMLAVGAVPKDSRVAKALEPLMTSTAQMQPAIVVATLDTEFKNPAEAGAAVSSYYKANMLERNKIIPAGSMGIKLNTNYIVTLPGFMSSTKFDLTNPAQATQYVIAKRLADIRNMQLAQPNPNYGQIGGNDGN